MSHILQVLDVIGFYELICELKFYQNWRFKIGCFLDEITKIRSKSGSEILIYYIYISIPTKNAQKKNTKAARSPLRLTSPLEKCLKI